MAETNELMARPKESDKLVMKRTLELFMPKVIAYLGKDYSESERPSIEEQISDVLAKYHDGYDAARELEQRHYWEQDRELVDLMDTGDSCRRQAYKEILSQWIQVYGITPSRKIGDKVGTTNWHRKGQVGTIGKIYEDRAEYGIHYPDNPATSHELIRYEEVIDAPEVSNADDTGRVDQQASPLDAVESR